MTNLGLCILLKLQNYHFSSQVVIITNLSLANLCNRGNIVLKLIISQSYLAIFNAIDGYYLIKYKCTSYLSKPLTLEGYCLIKWQNRSYLTIFHFNQHSNSALRALQIIFIYVIWLIFYQFLFLLTMARSTLLNLTIGNSSNLYAWYMEGEVEKR